LIPRYTSFNSTLENIATPTKLTTFEPKQCKQQGYKKKEKKQVDWALELKCENKEKNALETAPVCLQEGASGLSFTMVCIPKGMHSCPRVRDNYTAARLYDKTICRDENLIL